jgi:hypothetical protein
MFSLGTGGRKGGGNGRRNKSHICTNSSDSVWSVSRDYSVSMEAYDDNESLWPTWAVGALFRGARRIDISCVYFHITRPSLRSRDILVRAGSVLTIL